MLSFNKSNLNASGFTLIELLAVISIVGLLSASILASLNTARAKARDVRRIADIRQLANALYLYQTTFGHFPCNAAVGNAIETSLQPLVATGDIPSISNDPFYPVRVYEYFTFKDAVGSPCGQGAYFGIYFELPTSVCPFGGKKVGVANTHCHVFVPNPMPCTDPWDDNPEGSGPADCDPLKP